MAYLYTYSCMDVILSIKTIYQTVFFCQCYCIIRWRSLFIDNVTSKTLSFLQVEIFLKLISLKFPSCRLRQTNLPQNFIRFSIRKIQVQKPKLSLISFCIFGMMITFWSLMKTTVNAYGVIQVFKESIILRILLTYWGRRVCILKVVMFLMKYLI